LSALDLNSRPEKGSDSKMALPNNLLPIGLANFSGSVGCIEVAVIYINTNFVLEYLQRIW
jgi:hypothetical protein